MLPLFMLPKYSEIIDLLKKGATVEAQEKIMELREAAMELQEENLGLRAQVRNLEMRLDVQESMTYEGQVYWRWIEDDAGDRTIREGPFCPRCYDVDKALVRLYKHSEEYRICKHCERSYVNSDG